MNVFITLDYEIFFGSQQGSIEKTLLYPTERLLTVGRNTGAKFTFFIDCGFLVKLKEYQATYPQLAKEYQLVSAQLQKIVEEGHDCQLHIHPHWEKTTYNGENWVFDYNYYKLSDFKPAEIPPIFRKYSAELESITHKKITSFRAGGWCIQPFDIIKSSFEQEAILLDSSVFIGGKNTVSPYYYDYTNTPKKDFWHFEEEVCTEKVNGAFIELPISSYNYSPLFFWRLFILGNLFPKTHKPIGDGKPMPSPNFSRRKLLTRSHFLSASIDGYFTSKIDTILKRNKALNYRTTVLIGHPKALTHFSIQKLERIIQNNSDWCTFPSFTDFYNEISR